MPRVAFRQEQQYASLNDGTHQAIFHKFRTGELTLDHCIFQGNEILRLLAPNDFFAFRSGLKIFQVHIISKVMPANRPACWSTSTTAL